MSELTPEEIASIQGMPRAVAYGFLVAKRRAERRDTQAGDWDSLRAYLDNLGMNVTHGDPVKGQRVADFNDMVIDKLKKKQKDQS